MKARESIFFRSKITGNLILFVSSIVILLICAELVLRAMGYRPIQLKKASTVARLEGKVLKSHPKLGHTHRPGKFRETLGDSRTFTMTHLSNGRRVTQPLEAYTDEYSKDQIWIFGCSFTYGWSLNDEQTYPWRLQKNLPDYEIVNFGVIGYGTLHSFIQLQEALQKPKKPKFAIIVYASFHDERNTNLRRRQRRFVAAGLGPFKQPYARLNESGDITYSISTPYHEFPLMPYSLVMHVIEKVYNNIEDWFYHSHEVSKAIFKEISDLCKKNEIRLIVAGIKKDSLTSDMLEYAKELGNMTIDISVDLGIEGNRNLPEDPHPSAIANTQYAQKLGAFLTGTVLDLHTQ